MIAARYEIRPQMLLRLRRKGDMPITPRQLDCCTAVLVSGS
jgi:hypothetical protein